MRRPGISRSREPLDGLFRSHPGSGKERSRRPSPPRSPRRSRRSWPRARPGRSSRKGGKRTEFESLPVWRSRSSPGPFPLVHVRFDATVPPGARHASPSGRFPAAGSDDSSCEVRCARCSPGEDEVGEEGKQDRGTLPRGTWEPSRGLRGMLPASDAPRRAGALRPLAVGQSSVRRRHAWPAQPTRTLCHRTAPSQETICNFF